MYIHVYSRLFLVSRRSHGAAHYVYIICRFTVTRRPLSSPARLLYIAFSNSLNLVFEPGSYVLPILPPFLGEYTVHEHVKPRG